MEQSDRTARILVAVVAAIGVLVALLMILLWPGTTRVLDPSAKIHAVIGIAAATMVFGCSPSPPPSGDVVMRWIEQYLQEQTFDMEAFRSVYRLDAQTSFSAAASWSPSIQGAPICSKGVPVPRPTEMRVPSMAPIPGYNVA